MQNNYEHQCTIPKENAYQNYIHTTQFDGKVGMVSSYIFKNSKHYIIGYLNAIIHGLLTTTKEFKTYISAKHENPWLKYDGNKSI